MEDKPKLWRNERFNRAGRPDLVPRSRKIIRDEMEGSAAALQLKGRSQAMARGTAKIAGVQGVWQDPAVDANYRSMRMQPGDELMGLDVTEALQHFERNLPDTGDVVQSIVSKIPRSMRHLLAGGFAGGVSKTATAPIEFVRMQMMVNAGAGMRIGGIVSKTWAKGGPAAFFSGNLADVVRVTPSKAVQLAAFDRYKKMLSRTDKKTGKKFPPSGLQTTIAGGLAGVTSTITCFPLEVLRTRLACGDYTSMLDATTKILQKEGPRAFYSGVGPSIVGVIPYAAVNLGMYDGLRGVYQKVSGDTRVPKGVALVCGSLSGIVGATVTFPLEVVRRRMMMGAAYNNTWQALHTIARKEGTGALFNGCLLGWVKLAPSAGLSFYCYESAKELLDI